MSDTSSDVHYGPHPTDLDCRIEFDVCVIGSGASGSVVAHELVSAGMKVLMLEQGPFVQGGITYEDLIRMSEPAFGRMANGCWSLNGYPWSTCNVGGGTVCYGGASFRYREVDFDASIHFSDADLPVEWPYPYSELSKYYDQIEAMIGVAACPSADPTMPPLGETSYLPHVPISPAGMAIKKAAEQLGLSVSPTPLAILTKAFRDRSACNYDSPCIEQKCPVGAKGDAFTVFLRPIFQKNEFRLFAGMKVVRLNRQKRSSVNEAVALHVPTGNYYTFSAKKFVLAANAIQSAALLLRSSDTWSPNGIGNENDMVGRGLCFKLNEYVEGFRHEETSRSTDDPQQQAGGPFSTVAILDYYLDDRCPTGMGGMIYEANHGFRYAIADRARVLRLEAMLADQPSRNNRVRLARESDSHGLPRIVLDYNVHPRDAARLQFMVKQCHEILRKAGCELTRSESTEFQLGSCHLHGTCRGSRNPKDGVTDSFGRVHTVDNLFVADGGFMPFPSGLNPTLTIQAHALRVAQFLGSSAEFVGKRF
jgi:paromamine 6'-oxidase/6'''-hydroxyneomycin C oxidase/2'-deamino-2'-hydroxyparomamine 6'-oxidase